MRITHKLHLTKLRALLLTGALLLLAGLGFAFAPLAPVAAARQAVLAQLSANRVTRTLINAINPVVAAQQANGGGQGGGLWTDEAEPTRLAAKRVIIPQRARNVKLNLTAFKQLQQRIPREFSEAAKENPVIIELPLPEKGYGKFRIEESSIMAPELAQKFPEIKTYVGQGIDDPTATLRADFTPKGFHAQIIAEKGTVLIDPYAKDDTEHYISYWRKDYQRPREEEQFRCFTVDPKQPSSNDLQGAQRPSAAQFVNQSTLRTYRLALAATGEYTTFQGGTVAAAMAAMTTTMNRVNGVYEREVGVRMTLVANNNLIIYTNGATDPYTNGTPNTMVTENQTNIDNVIGSANYDIGHVFGTNSGGYAPGDVCNNGNKAQGVTGSAAPTGDSFDIDYVAHEMGHQFGADHTFNDGSSNSCGGGTRTGSSAYEPGSGTTIMAYAGICAPANTQIHTSPSPAYFHARSLDQIISFITGTATCSTNTTTGNNAPTISAGPDYNIPRGTPFTLTATGNDANGDAITYDWEEYDLGAASPPESDDGSRPIYRSYPPTSSNTRTFPSLTYILNNANMPPATIPCPDGTSQTCISGEVLHSMGRSATFRVTARDNRAAGGAVQSDDVAINVQAGAGPFLVTYPTAGVIVGGNTLTVTWSVAGTTGNNINTANVRILLSLDDGQTFPFVLAASTPNDGSETVPTLGQQSQRARIRVEAIGNIFFDISEAFVLQQQADLAASKAATAVADPDGAGPLAPVALPTAGPNVPAGSVNAGGYIRYDIPFGNSGPSDAINVVLHDVIPGNTAFVGALTTGGAFVPATQPPAVPFTFTIPANDTDGFPPNGPAISVSCTVTGSPGNQNVYCRPQGNTALTPPVVDGTLPAGYTGTLTFFVRVNESVAGGSIVSNPATINSGFCPTGATPPYPPTPCGSTADPQPANNTTLPTSTVVVASSNLAISKIVQSAVTSASNPNQTGPIGPGTPPNGAATTGTAVLPGTFLTYRITLTNNGPSDVSNIRLIDVLPSGLETPPGRVLGARFVSATPVFPSGATFTCAPPAGVNPSNNPQSNGGTVVCTAPLLSANAPNNTAAIDITVFIDPATKASLVDTATFDATINNFNRPISGSATLTTPVAPTSNLALTKSLTNAAGVVNGPVTAGTTFTYTVTLTNGGPSAAQMVSLVDTFPAFQRVTNIAINQTPDGNGAPNFTCTAVPAVGAPGNTTSVTCTAPELPPNRRPDNTVNPSGTVVFTFTVVQDPLTAQPLPTVYQNCVSVTSMSTDPVAANSTNVCLPVNLIFQANPTGTKTDTPDPVIAGNLLTYTIAGANPGPSAALNFMISDPLPTGTVFISAVASPGATLTTPPVGANGTVKATWDAAGGTPGGLTAPGTTRTLTIVVRVCPDFQQVLGLTDAQMCVPNLTNTATISSDTPGTPATATSTTTVQAQSDLSIAKTGPASAPFSTTSGPSNVTYTLTFSNAGPSNASGVRVVDVLPKGFTVVGAPTSTVPGTTFTTATAAGVTTVTANVGVLGAANQCSAARPTSGTITIIARVPIKNPVQTVTNTATISTSNCLPDPNLANNTASADTFIFDPAGGLGSFPAAAEVSDQKAGSVLFYPIYTSDVANPAGTNTRISLTNVSGTERVAVHLFAVDGASCAVLDAFICLTPNQTTSFLASDVDPGNTGYLMAVAVDYNTGLPRSFNCLIGDEFVKFASGHRANLGAEAISAVMNFPAGLDTTATTTTLRFDGMFYNRLPRILALDSVGSLADGNSTMLILNRVGGNFLNGGDTIGNLVGLLFNDQEVSFSFTARADVCQLRQIISATFPRTFPPVSSVIPAGRTGWIKLFAVEDRALFGAALVANATVNSSPNAYAQGHNLHKLTLTDAATITLPLFTPSCNF